MEEEKGEMALQNMPSENYPLARQVSVERVHSSGNWLFLGSLKRSEPSLGHPDCRQSTRQLLAKRVLGDSLPFRECHDENKQIKASPQMLHFNISQENLKPDKKNPRMRANAIFCKLT